MTDAMTNTSREALVIRIDSEVTRRVRQHARAHMQTEVCGVLIGRFCDGAIEIKAPIEAFNASQAGAHVTFTQAAWETIYRVKDKDYPEDRIVGWYHSHPGFGVFLSDHDTFIHSNFFSSPDQVAWVYDPHSDEEGCFGWVDGSIRRMASLHIEDRSGEDMQPVPEKIAAGHPFPEASMWQIETKTTRPIESSIPQNRFESPARSNILLGIVFVAWVGCMRRCMRWSRSLLGSVARRNGHFATHTMADQSGESAEPGQTE